MYSAKFYSLNEFIEWHEENRYEITQMVSHKEFLVVVYNKPVTW